MSSSTPEGADVSEIAKTYGGGGHPAVGAVSLAQTELERTRQIAREITQILRTAARSE